MQIKQSHKYAFAWCTDSAEHLQAADFSAAPWQQNNAITGQSKGRYTTWFVQPEQVEQQWVLRHYWRGGLAEKLSKDAYLYTGLHNTRAIAELGLLEQLYNEGFAVPKPIAAQIQRFGIWYRADIIIERIAGAQDLVAILSAHPMNDALWFSLGVTIAKFHQRGVYHADLNAKNILLTGEQFYLIDFDRGELRKANSHWQQANISRLKRSFDKEKTKLPKLAFTENNWQQLLKGYQQQLAAA
ncbi:3-deoxy-D-manno-octulosonic acid kinase [Shewanella maritima]|uniref:3-deoxy-D-manno-octulosonic acid kinase n=1 Tax=Shewanella maritima TaxID=2520507 RepID=UPI00373690DB